MEQFKIISEGLELSCNLLANLTVPDCSGIPSGGDEHLVWYESASENYGVLLDGPTLHLLLETAQRQDLDLQTQFYRDWVQDIGWCEAEFPSGRLLELEDFRMTMESLEVCATSQEFRLHLLWMSRIIEQAKREGVPLRIAR